MRFELFPSNFKLNEKLIRFNSVDTRLLNNSQITNSFTIDNLIGPL